MFAYREHDAVDMMLAELVRSRWLGYPGATEAQLAAAEEQLGVALPPSYRAFLATANGCWLVSGYWFAYPFWSTEQVESFAERNQAWIDAWLEGYHWYGPQRAVTDEEYLVYGPEQGDVFREEYLQATIARTIGSSGSRAAVMTRSHETVITCRARLASGEKNPEILDVTGICLMRASHSVF